MKSPGAFLDDSARYSDMMSPGAATKALLAFGGMTQHCGHAA
jgi:hypothetical protein